MAAYRHLGNGIYVGLTTDTKPTAANTANGAIAIEWATNYATFTLYVNNQTAWLPETSFAQTLVNKTLTSPIISSISNTGTLTLPTSTDTLVGKATTDILTNKSMDADTNTMTNMFTASLVKKFGIFHGSSGSAGLGCSGIWAGALATIIVGTGSLGGLRSSAGMKVNYTSGTTINSLGGNKFTVSMASRNLNPVTEWRLRLTQTTNQRVFFGYIGATASPVSGADPLTGLSGVMFGMDTGVDNNWHIYQNDGTGGSDSTTIANVAAADTSTHIFGLRGVDASTKFQYQYDGGTWTDINTTIPAADTALNWMWWIECLVGSAAKTFDVFAIRHVQDD